MNDFRRRRLLLIAKVALVSIVLLSAFAQYLRYSIRTAEKSAKQFCNQIVPGSDISAAIAKAKDGKIFYGTEGGYAFYFPTITGFDKAVCGVSVDDNGRVLSTRWEMEFD